MSLRRYLRPLPFLFVAAAALAGTAAPSRHVTDSVPRDSVPELVRSLERDPLDRRADAIRTRLLTWVTMADLGPCGVDATYIAELEKALERSAHPYRRELAMQYMFGAARGALQRRPEDDCRAEVESGLRSLIAAYRTIARDDRLLRNHYLDSLDDIRRRGKLRSYIHDREIRK